MDPATGRPYDHSLLQATLADATRAGDGGAADGGPERHLGLAGSPAAAPGSLPPAAPAGDVDPSSLRLGALPAQAAAGAVVAASVAAPAPVRPKAAPPVTPLPTAAPKAAPAAAPSPAAAPAPAHPASSPAADAAGARPDLRAWMPSDDDLLPPAPRRGRRGLHR